MPDRVWSWEPDPDSPIPAGRADRALAELIAGGAGAWDPAAPDAPPSRSQLQGWMEDGLVTQSGRPLKASARLEPRGAVRIAVPAPRPLELAPEARELETLWEDEHLLVLNKPAGLTVHPSSTQAEGTLVHALLARAASWSGIGGALRPGIVHRLDKDTSGALVVAKSDRAHRGLVEIFSRHEIEREYWALVYGAPVRAPGLGTGEIRIETTIGRNPADRKRMAAGVTGGRQAVTRYRVEETYRTGPSPYAAWIRARLETGRTHQIRVHLTAEGCSLLGDPVYGAPSTRQGKWLALPEEVRALVAELPGQALHARTLGFRHPVTGADVRAEAEPPPAFARLRERMRADRVPG